MKARILDGYLSHGRKSKKRWIVFQGDKETGIFQLKIFKKSDEKILKIAHTLTKDTFVGIERGEVGASKRSHKDGETFQYLAVILANDTVIFQENTASSSLAEWHSAISEYFVSYSWDVELLTGVCLPESEVVLHITQRYITLATTDPPKACHRWQLGRVTDYGVWGARVYLCLDNSKAGHAGYVELRAPTVDQANSIRATLIRLLPYRGSEVKTPLSGKLATALKSPTTKGRQGVPFTGEPQDNGLIFNFQGLPVREPGSTSPCAPPVSPRPASTLVSSSSPQSPHSLTLHSNKRGMGRGRLKSPLEGPKY